MNLINFKDSYTIGEWTDIWMELYAKVRLKENSQQIHIDSRRRVLVRFHDFENMQLTSLSPMQFQFIINSFADNYSKSTITKIKRLYNSVYKYAIKNNVCVNNPITDTEIPNAPTKVVEALTQKEELQFIGALKSLNIIDEYTLRFFLYTGLRRSELIHLKWSDWDRKDNRIQVTDSKTAKGIRTIYLIPEARFILHALYHRQHVSKDSSPYIFSINKQPLNKYHLRYICKKAAKIARIQHVTPHMLRHTFATRLLEKGANIKAVSNLLGHANVAFTMRTYISLDKNYVDEQIMLISDIKKESA